MKNGIYETAVLCGNRYSYVGWFTYDSTNEFITETKDTKNFLYVTYTYMNGRVERRRYRKNTLIEERRG
jgi:hypothetical protein